MSTQTYTPEETTFEYYDEIFPKSSWNQRADPALITFIHWCFDQDASIDKVITIDDMHHMHNYFEALQDMEEFYSFFGAGNKDGTPKFSAILDFYPIFL